MSLPQNLPRDKKLAALHLAGKSVCVCSFRGWGECSLLWWCMQQNSPQLCTLLCPVWEEDESLEQGFLLDEPVWMDTHSPSWWHAGIQPAFTLADKCGYANRAGNEKIDPASDTFLKEQLEQKKLFCIVLHPSQLPLKRGWKCKASTLWYRESKLI